MIAQTLITTGLGSKVAGLVEALSGGHLIIALLITMVVSIVLGCGVPPVAAYALVAIVAVPSIINMGVPPMAAHFFCFYFSIISALTPPVALGALAAAGIAEANYFKTAVQSFKLAISGFIIPYLIVFNPIMNLKVHSTFWAVGSLVAIPLALISMGADIKGAGSSTITINGVSGLKPLNYSIVPDRIETGTFIAAAAITGGEVVINRCRPEHSDSFINKLKEVGVSIEAGEGSLIIKGPDRLKSEDIKTMPYPGFPTDMQAQFMALMTIADSSSLITESIFENRFMHVAELRRLGADIKVEGSTSTVKGVKKLKGAPVMATDLRASASLVIAALAAEGTTVIDRVYHIDRGYEKIEEKLKLLGANIRRIK